MGKLEFGLGHFKSKMSDNIQKGTGYLNLEVRGQVRPQDRK